jgi:ribosome maturation factor RimP
MTHGHSDRLRGVIEPLVAGAGFDLEDVTIISAGRRRVVRIVIDSDAGVDLDAAAQVSTAVSARLDDGIADDVFGDQAYTLEVTSPGIGRPLTLPRHFRRATGRMLTITRNDGSSTAARMRRIEDGQLVLLDGPSGLDESIIDLADVRRAVVEVEFSPVPPEVAAILAADAGEAGPGVDENQEGAR